MSFNELLLGSGQLASGSQTTIYTCPTHRTAILKHITISNANASSRTVQVWIVPNGGSVSDDNCLLNGQTVYGNRRLTWDGFIPIAETGATIQAEASAASSLTMFAAGGEVEAGQP